MCCFTAPALRAFCFEEALQTFRQPTKESVHVVDVQTTRGLQQHVHDLVHQTRKARNQIDQVMIIFINFEGVGVFRKYALENNLINRVNENFYLQMRHVGLY